MWVPRNLQATPVAGPRTQSLTPSTPLDKTAGEVLSDEIVPEHISSPATALVVDFFSNELARVESSGSPNTVPSNVNPTIISKNATMVANRRLSTGELFPTAIEPLSLEDLRRIRDEWKELDERATLEREIREIRARLEKTDLGARGNRKRDDLTRIMDRAAK